LFVPCRDIVSRLKDATKSIIIPEEVGSREAGKQKGKNYHLLYSLTLLSIEEGHQHPSSVRGWGKSEREKE